MSAAIKKRGLGRGLDALLEDRAVDRLPIGDLKPSPSQPRTEFEPTALAELTESIRAQGIVQPIVVTAAPDGGWWIVAGERRWRAAQRAGLTEVPVSVRAVADERELLELALVENLQRSDLNALEEAEAYRQLAERFHLSQEDIAKRVGKARPTVANSLRLLHLPAEIQDLLRSGQLSAGQARPLLAIDSAERQLALAREAVEKSLPARVVERAASGQAPERKKKVAARQEPEVFAAAAQEKLTQRYQTKVEIQRRTNGGAVVLHFHSEDELIRLYELLMERGGNR